MKKHIIKLFLVLTTISCLVCSVSLIAYAHAGKTDEYGGHFDGKTGEYHYHHGYPAHQHENGICPYDYNDNADHSSSSYSSDSINGEYTTVEHQSTTEHFQYPYNKSSYNNENRYVSKLSQPVKIGIIVTISIIVFCSVSYIFFYIINKKIRKKKCMEYINILRPQLEQITKDENDIRLQIRQQISYNLYGIKQEENNVDSLYEKIKLKNPKIYYEYHYGNKTIEYVAGFPEGIYLKEGNLLDSQSHEPFGRFTGYIVNTGKVVHAKYGCSGAYEPIHLIENRQEVEKRHPCQKCMMHSLKYKYYNEVPEWYLNYINIKRIKYLYNIK